MRPVCDAREREGGGKENVGELYAAEYGEERKLQRGERGEVEC